MQKLHLNIYIKKAQQLQQLQRRVNASGNMRVPQRNVVRLVGLRLSRLGLHRLRDPRRTQGRRAVRRCVEEEMSCRIEQIPRQAEDASESSTLRVSRANFRHCRNVLCICIHFFHFFTFSSFFNDFS